MTRILPFLFILFVGSVFGQTKLSSQAHDFGDLYAYSERYIDIQLQNIGAKKEFLLNVRKTNEVFFIQSGNTLLPDSIITLRFQVNPSKKGKFNYLVQVYVSDKMEPYEIQLKGNLQELPYTASNAGQDCPSFGVRPANSNPLEFDMHIQVVDAESKQPIEKAEVLVLQNGQLEHQFKSNRKGQIDQTMTLGLAYFYAQKEGYVPSEMGTYVNRQRNVLVIEMKQEERKEPIVLEEVIVIEEETPVQSEVVENEIEELEHEVFEYEIEEEEIAQAEEEKEPEVIITIEEVREQLKEEQVVPVELNQLATTDFSAEYFKPVNVSFVLDVSSSMNNGDKMELLKYALQALNAELRPTDYISIITYADHAKVLLDPTNGTEKEKVNERVQKLKAGGLTAGGEGIKLGYKENLKSYLPDGANHVIVITDGAFNKASKDYKKFVRKFRKKGITLSIVGVKNAERDAEKMVEAAELGGGRYIPIMKLSDAQNNLFQEIRYISFRR